jgi:putative ABC transport system permease protein
MPAEAMRPEAPANFRAGIMEQSGVVRWLSASMRMILRNLSRKPWKALLSVVGIGLAVGLMMVSRFMLDAVDHMMMVQFNLVQRDDVTVLMQEPRAAGALYDLRQLPGVLSAETFRAVPVRLKHEHRSKQVEVIGLSPDSELRQIVDVKLRAIALPPDGLLPHQKLAQVLGVKAGDMLTLEVLDGGRQVREMSIAGLSDEFIGMGAYMDAGALARLLREDNLISGAWLHIDPAFAEPLYARLKRMPAVSGVVIRSAMIKSVQEIVDTAFNLISKIEMLLATVLIGGMVYNSVRIALSERGTELASLRVWVSARGGAAAGRTGFAHLCALPVGCSWHGMCAALVPAFDRELFRLPLVFSAQTFIYPVLTTLVAALLTALLVARRLRNLDLIAVLKTRE